MKEIDDGGFAFPTDESPMVKINGGMSLRDWFAGNIAVNQMQLNEYNVNQYQAQTTARWAYMVADEMIAARKVGVE